MKFEEITEQESIIAIEKKKLKAMTEQWITATCPVKRGQVLRIPDTKPYGGRRAKVYNILVQEKYVFRLLLQTVNEDGTDGKRPYYTDLRIRVSETNRKEYTII